MNRANVFISEVIFISLFLCLKSSLLEEKKNGFSVSFVKIEQKESLLNVARTIGILRDELFFIVVMLFQTATAEKQDKTVAFDTDTLSHLVSSKKRWQNRPRSGL